ncbi:hypothetical protein [Amycolatopsis samaneae]|uniref:3-oxoacyl-[acyl-carrier-protein] synthase-3 n=1 Tax=Amycolatopsis samaneae TaxID=664691 RepID=A0ABW5GW78_9PSEU
MAGGAVAGAQVVSLGHYLPETVVTTAEVAARIGVEEDWVVARTGIRERRVAAKDETVADMATAAALDALGNLAADTRYAHGLSRIDTVIVATSTAESTMPNAPPRSPRGPSRGTPRRST